MSYSVCMELFGGRAVHFAFSCSRLLGWVAGMPPPFGLHTSTNRQQTRLLQQSCTTELAAPPGSSRQLQAATSFGSSAEPALLHPPIILHAEECQAARQQPLPTLNATPRCARHVQAAQRDRSVERQQVQELQDALDEAQDELEALSGEAAAAAALRDELAARWACSWTGSGSFTTLCKLA
jgi:hypothetical protein